MRDTAVRCRFEDLDDEVRAYLNDARRMKDRHPRGAYAPQEAEPPRYPTYWPLLAGAVCVAVVALLCLAGVASTAATVAKCVLTPLGVLLLVRGTLAWRFARRNRLAGQAFAFVDASHVWQFDSGAVRVTAVRGAVAVTCRHLGGPGSQCEYVGHVSALDDYHFSVISITLPGDLLELTVRGRQTAERFARFVSALIDARVSDGPLAQDEAALGDFARQASLGYWPIEVNLAVRADGPPRPASGEAGRKARRRRVGVQVAAVAAAALVAGLVFPPLDRRLSDDHSFAKARESAIHSESPTGLRNYLADGRNTRHRAEAQELINGFYDKAIERVKRLRGRAGTDPALHDALLALLEALKTADTPVVKVGFRATQEDGPAGQHAEIEKLVYEAHLRDEPRLKEIAEGAPGKTAILPRGQVFAADQTALREAVILTQLREALAKVLKSDLLALVPAEAGEPARIEITYRVYAPGRLYRYVQSGPFGLGDWPKGRQDEDPIILPGVDGQPGVKLPRPRHWFGETVKGLVRGYELEWEITFRPPGREGEQVWRLPSKPADQLKYDRERGDPDWAPYAIMLHSGFVDMSARLVKGFGLEAQEPPDRYSFATATGKDRR
jgi:hypothetical protein